MATHWDAGGRHRIPRQSTKWLVAAVVTAVLTGAAVGALSLRGDAHSSAAACPRTEQPLRVAAAPDIAPAVTALAKSVVLTGCTSTRIEVTATDPSAFAASLRHPAAGLAAVWIPDSSLWLAKPAHGAALPGTSHGSIARSPIVLAVAPEVARRFGSPPSLRRLAAASTSTSPVVLGGRDPQSSAPALGMLVSLQATLAREASTVGNLAALLQTMTTTDELSNAPLPAHPETLDGSPVAIPTTEQAVWAADHASSHETYTAVYPTSSPLTLDFPFVTLTRDKNADRVADALLSTLRGAAGRSTLQASGFRSSTGAPGTQLSRTSGVDATAPATSGGPSATDVAAVLHSLQVVRMPSRLLAVIDVSGSMAATVPGQEGSTRIDIARTAAASGLGLLPPGSEAGLWRFSTDLTPTSDYQELVPVAPLNDGTRGLLAAGISRLEAVPDGGTGLYDSISAAVATMRKSFDPTRVNSVVVLTDGRDEANSAHAVSLRALLAALKTESASTRPVKVVAIAYGPDSDTAALRAISAASGGILYTSPDPRDLPAIFRNAIGQRLCSVKGC